MPRPKIILQIYPMLPAVDEDDRKAKRPLGRNAELYHDVLHGWLDILKAAEDLGAWGAATIEHHLHSEGYEVGPNPGILNAWWASQFKRLHIGALGYVMATQDPIRVAEETAILDHITRGKFFVGLARGYQSRWTNILGQFTDSVATVSDGSRDDVRNRDIFEERVEMLLECWTEDSVALNGNYYQAPTRSRLACRAIRPGRLPATPARSARSRPRVRSVASASCRRLIRNRTHRSSLRPAEATTRYAIVPGRALSRPFSPSGTLSCAKVRSTSRKRSKPV